MKPAASTCNFHGHVDVISRNVISGWAEDPNSNDPVLISVFINSKEVKTVECADHRQDVLDAGFRNGRTFYLNPIRNLAQGLNVIEVRFAKTDALVPNGRATLEYDREKHIGDHWSSMYADRHQFITRWWQCEKIVKRINQRVCGVPVAGLSHGLYKKLQNQFIDHLPFRRGVSVGCGEAVKEIDFVQMGLAESFDLYELSKYAIQQGRRHIENAGLARQMTYFECDAFSVSGLEGRYDVVFWNNSLHHMFDVASAIEWSRAVLRSGGVFVMDDFVGPSHMQWSDRMLEINTRVRERLPTRYLQDPRDQTRRLPVKIERPNLDEFCAIDPSECADSGRILDSVKQHFPAAKVVLTGGGVYHLALNDVLHNILMEDDQATLDQILKADDECIDLGETHYAVAIAVKD